MTLNNKIKKWLRPRQFAGIELGQKDDAFYYHLVVLQEEKGEIKTVDSHLDLPNLEAVVSALEGKRLPVFLTLNVRGILHKIVADKKANDRALLEAVLPNSQTGEFFLQRQPGTDGIWASLIRQENASQILDQFAEKGLWVTGVILGPFAVQSLWSFMQAREVIATSSYQIDFDPQGYIRTLQRSDADTAFSTITLEGETLHSVLLPAFASAFMGLIDAPAPVDIPSVGEAKAEYFHQSLFKKGSWALLLGLLGILLLNTFFYYQYKDQNQQLSSQVLYADAQLQLLDSLQSQVSRQEDFMQQTSLNQNSKTSFYADRIAASLPADLQLSELEIFPLQGKIRDYREGQLVRYQKDRIQIKGFCKNSEAYNAWLKTLEEMDWVQRAEHLEYRDLNNRLSSFELQLFIVPSK